jgi:phosphonate transport system permease protein
MAAEQGNTDRPPTPEMPSRFTANRMLIAVVFIAVYSWSVEGTGLSIVALIEGLPDFWQLGQHMFPPSLEGYEELWVPFLETLFIGILATIIGSVFAIPIGFLGAANLSHPVIYYPIRLVLTVFRGVSEVIWALLFVVAVGLGPMPGVLALCIFAVGVQSKLVAEAVEAVDPGPLEAIRTTGASPWKVFLYGAWPQVLPLYLTYALYYWDHNTRQATILGFVGAGGLGQKLLWDISVYEFEKATTSIVLMIVLITAIDRFCLYLRSKII